MKILLTGVCLLACFYGSSQGFPAVDYPRSYFRDPLNIPIGLAANFGELRPNHYHMGLDIRTQHRENLPVFAAADGYVARVVVEPGGFGQAIYIRHPNGYTTLYAHLNEFYPALTAYVQEQQYKVESWAVSLDIPAGMFTVKKGAQIALSGNRGGSQGPHLHFEIRRTSDDVNLNPMLFGLPIPDHVKPVIQRLAVYDRMLSVYEQSPLVYPVAKLGLIKVASPRVSFAITTFDSQTGSTNPNGIYQAVLYDGDSALSGFRMNEISYNDTRNINAHIDYKARATGGGWLQHLSKLPGYGTPSIYSGGDGIVDLSDRAIHPMRIEVKDADGNVTTLNFRVQYDPAGATVKGMPLTGKMFYPGMIDGVETADCAFYIGEKSLYDSVHLDTKISGYPGAGHSLPGALSAMHTVGAGYIPLAEPVLVRLRPNTTWADTANTHVVMVCQDGDRRDVRKPEWQGGWASARFRGFGNFQLVDDEEAPVISFLPVTAKRIVFYVKDNLGATGTVRAMLDGKWLCFTNDKGLAYIYTFDAHCPAGKHVLTVEATDAAGNKATKTINFTK